MNRASPLRKRNSPNKNNQEEEEARTGLKYFPIFDPKQRRSHTKEDAKKTSAAGRQKTLAALGDARQLTLDAGQTQYGPQECAVCGLVYDAADPDDAALHREQHNRTVRALHYANWKTERVVSEVDPEGGRCVLVTSSDPPYCWRKVTEVLSVVDEELGYAGEEGRRGAASCVLYVLRGSVAGCLVAERAERAHRVVPQDAASASSPALLCCSTETVPIRYGVNRIWVRQDHRRRGLASALLDAFRRNAVAYHYLALDEFAFSDPTTAGVAFAARYTGKRDFLVYRHGE